MKINIDRSQNFNHIDKLTLSPLVTNWQIQSSRGFSAPVFIFMRNQPTSGMLEYQIKPKSNRLFWSFEGYTNMRIVTEVVYPSTYSTPLGISTPLYPEIAYNNTTQDSWHDLTITVSPSLSTPLGLHVVMVKFKIVGNLNGIEDVLSSYDLPVSIHVFDEGYYNSPLNFTFYKNINGTPLQELVVGGNNWVLNVPRGLIVTSQNVDVIANTSGGFTASGSGNKIFMLGLNASSIDDVVGSATETNLNLIVTYSNQQNNIPVRIFQTGAVYPLRLIYNIASGLVDNYYQNIVVNRSGNISYQAPEYLIVHLIETDELNYLQVSVADPDSFGSGTFNDNISIDVDGLNYLVNVLVNVNDQFDVGIENNEISFTRSMPDLVFQTTNQNTYMQVDFTSNQSTDLFRYKLPYMSGIARKNIGVVLDRIITFDSDNLESNFNIPTFNLSLVEKQGQTNILEFQRNQIPVMKGYAPLIRNNKMILQHCTKSRFFKNGFGLVSVLSLNGTFEYKLFVNQTEVFYSSTMFGFISTININFADYDLVPGDVLTFALIVDSDEYITKDFYIFEETESQLDIVYVDSFGLKQVICFSGNQFKIERELKQNIETFRSKSEFYSRKVKVSSLKKIVLNTGFILSEQTSEVAELLDSLEAWIYKDGVKLATIIPTTDKMVEKSDDLFLINYTVEFNLNISDHAQGYNW